MINAMSITFVRGTPSNRQIDEPVIYLYRVCAAS